MPGHKPRTNKGLAIAAVLMCLACGVSFTQSSASHSPITDTQIPDMFVYPFRFRHFFRSLSGSFPGGVDAS